MSSAPEATLALTSREPLFLRLSTGLVPLPTAVEVICAVLTLVLRSIAAAVVILSVLATKRVVVLVMPPVPVWLIVRVPVALILSRSRFRAWLAPKVTLPEVPAA